MPSFLNWNKKSSGGKKAAFTSSDADKRLVLSLSNKSVPSAKQLLHLPRFLSPKESLFMKLLLALMGVSLVIMGTKFVADHTVRVPDDGGTYEEAAVGQPRLANPILTTANDADLDIIRLVFSGLMRTDGAGRLVPDLAESITVSEDGKTYTAKLRDNIKWHDGTAFTAQDVVETVNFIKTPGWKSPLAGQFKNVEARATDDRTVTFTLQAPFAPFLSTLTVGILPAHLWRDVKPENASRAELNLKPIGTGPFRFKSFVKDKKGGIRSYLLTRNDEYYGTPAHLASIGFKFYPDFASAAEALKGRKADGISFLPLELRDSVQDFRSTNIITLKLPQYTAVFFNMKKNEPLKSKAVRQALSLAVDRTLIIRDILKNNAEPARGPIPPGFVGYATDARGSVFDLTKAAGLLDQDGWKLDEDGIRKQDVKDAKGKVTGKTTLSIALVTVDTKENMAVAEAVKDAWNGLGVQTELSVVPASRIQKDVIRPREYDALIYGEIVGADPDLYPFWHSSQANEQGLNLSMFVNRNADALLEQERSATKEEDRAAAYRQFQEILADEVPAIFLYRPTYVFAMGRKIKGFGVETIFTPADRFADAAEWYTEMTTRWKK